MATGYGTVAITGDAWINERAQKILSAGLPSLPQLPGEMRRFDPSQPRDEHGRWSVIGAIFKVAAGTFRLEHHGDRRVSLHDEHGGSLDLTGADLVGGGGRSGKFRHFAFAPPRRLEEVGQRDWMNRHETRHGKPHTTVLAGLRKTHLGTGAEAGDEHDAYELDRQTLHLPAGGKGVEDPGELFSRPGTEMTTAELEKLADTLQSFSATQDHVDTGHGSIAMHVVGKDYTLDTGKRGERPIVLNRAEMRTLGKALNAAFEAWDPDESEPLPAGQRFQQTIHIKGAGGDVVVTRNGPGEDFYIENDTMSIRITPDAFHRFSHQLDIMINADLRHLSKPQPSLRL